jgi:hypothetical protein
MDMVKWLKNVEVTKLGGYQTVDKTEQRQRILGFLEQKGEVCLGGEKRKLLPKIKGGLQFNENGKWISRKK